MSDVVSHVDLIAVSDSVDAVSAPSQATTHPPGWENTQRNLHYDVIDSIEKLIAVVDALNAITAISNATINNNPAAVIKDLARECKTIARQATRIARLVTSEYSSSNVGAA